MNLGLVSLAILSLLAFSYTASPGKVIELTDYTFDENIEKNPIIMVVFYAPWCGKSKAILAEFTKAAKLIPEIGKSYVLAKIDATSQTEVADKIGISTFPVVKLYLNKKPINSDIKEYTADSIIRFIDKQVRPPSVELFLKEEIEGLKGSKGTKCLLIGDDANLREEFIAVAKLVKDLPFYHISQKLGQEYFADVSPVPAVLLIKGKTDERFVLSENLNKESISEFIQLNLFPLLNTFTQDVIAQMLKPYGRIGVVLFRLASDPLAKKYEAEFEKMATQHKLYKYLFIISDPQSGMDEKVAKHIGLEGSKLPLMAIVERKEDLGRYEYRGELTAEGMGKYLDDFMAGKITRSVKTEDEPAENSGPVYTVVGKTFERDVLDNDMDVFVKFYAPWCGHCKTMAPIYEHLASRLKGSSKVKLVQVDATKNEIQGHNVQSFPTLKLFVGGKKSEAVVYEGQRTEEAMLDFLKKNCKNEVIVSGEKTEQAEEKKEAPEKDDGGMCDSSCKDKKTD